MKDDLKGVAQRISTVVDERDEYLKILTGIKRSIEIYYKSDEGDPITYNLMTKRLLLDIYNVIKNAGI